MAKFADPTASIDACYNIAEKERFNKNRAMLKPIVETAIFLAKCGLAFRGHRDSGSVICPETIKDLDGTKGDRIFVNFLFLSKYFYQKNREFSGSIAV